MRGIYVDPNDEEDYLDEVVNQQNEYKKQQARLDEETRRSQANYRPIKRRGNQNPVMVIALIFVAVVVIGTGVLAYFATSKTLGSNPNVGKSPEQIVNEYNAAHGKTIYGETLTPSSNEAAPVIVATNPAVQDTQGVPGVIPSVAADANGCITAQVGYLQCTAENICYVLVIGSQTAFQVPIEQKDNYQVGANVTVCK